MHCTPMGAIQCVGVTLESDYRLRAETYQCQAHQCPKLCTTNLYVQSAVYSEITEKWQNLDSSEIKTAVANVYLGELAFTLASVS